MTDLYDYEGGPDGIGQVAEWTLCEFCEGLIAPSSVCVEC